MTSISLQSLAKALNAEIVGNAAACDKLSLTGVATLLTAKSTELAVMATRHQIHDLSRCKASVLLATPEFKPCLDRCALIVLDIQKALSNLRSLFQLSNPTKDAFDSLGPVHLSPSAMIAEDVVVGPYTVIEDNVTIASGVTIGAHCHIKANAVLENNTTLGSQVMIGEQVSIGKECIIGDGSVIGANPFAFEKNKGRWQPQSSIGAVRLDDSVEIGANVTINAGVTTDTHVAVGVKIDNQVLVAHDVRIGKHSIIMGSALIGATSSIGAHCTIGGGAAIGSLLVITDEVSVTARTTVNRSIQKAGVYSSGVTAQPHHQWRKNVARFHRLDILAQRLRQLQHTVELQRESHHDE